MAQLFFLLSALAAASALRPGGLYLGIDLSTQSCTAVVTARARQSRRGGATISTPRSSRGAAATIDQGPTAHPHRSSTRA